MRNILSPRELAEAIGVSESSVKRWVDEGLIRATRTAGGHRRIPVTEAVRFVRESRSILVRPELLGLAELAKLRGSEPAYGEEADLLFDLLKRGAEEESRGLLLSLFLDGRSVAQLVDGPLRIAMERIGACWREEEPGIYWEHRATDLAFQAVSRLRSLIEVPPRAPAAAGGAPAGDTYILPSLAVATVLASQGLRAVNLGPETPIDTLSIACRDLGARLAWLSVSVAEEPEKLAREVESWAADLEERRVPLLVGGRAIARLRLRSSDFLYVGSSMVELEAMVRGLRLAGNGAPLEESPAI